MSSRKSNADNRRERKVKNGSTLYEAKKSKKSIKEDFKRTDLDQVEKFADKALAPLDVEFTNHFFDRVLDPRNGKLISAAELVSFFKRLAQKKATFIDFLKKYKEFVTTNKKFDLNIPFVRMANKLVAKTIMRKADFKTPDPKFTFEALPKKKWTDVEPEKYSDDLIDLVQTAYKSAPEGSFIRSKADLMGSDWHSIDYNKDPDVDATIFYRRARGSEPWNGLKIQGIGHDGERPSIDLVLKRLKVLLNKSGVWVEASDALEHVLYKMGVPYVSDEAYAQKVFPNSDLKMTGDRGKYTRKIAGGKVIKETIFGKPKLKKG